MGPDGLASYQGGIEHESAEIIDGSNEIPFFSRRWCPEVVRGVVLNEFAGVMRQDFAVVGFVDFIFNVKAVFFSFCDDGG